MFFLRRDVDAYTRPDPLLTAIGTVTAMYTKRKYVKQIEICFWLETLELELIKEDYNSYSTCKEL